MKKPDFPSKLYWQLLLDTKVVILHGIQADTKSSCFQDLFIQVWKYV